MSSRDNKSSGLSPIALGYLWVSRIMTVVLEMILPGIAGNWVDSKLNTNYWALVGFGVGLSVAMLHLIQMTRDIPQGERRRFSKSGPTAHRTVPPVENSATSRETNIDDVRPTATDT